MPPGDAVLDIRHASCAPTLTCCCASNQPNQYCSVSASAQSSCWRLSLDILCAATSTKQLQEFGLSCVRVAQRRTGRGSGSDRRAQVSDARVRERAADRLLAADGRSAGIDQRALALGLELGSRRADRRRSTRSPASRRAVSTRHSTQSHVHVR